MKENLRPCPFCGSAATIIESSEGEDDVEIWILSCDKCPAEMRGCREPLIPPIVKGDTCIDWSTGVRVEYTDAQIQYLNENTICKDGKEDLIKAWNNRV